LARAGEGLSRREPDVIDVVKRLDGDAMADKVAWFAEVSFLTPYCRRVLRTGGGAAVHRHIC
jgi:hypothetical protein